MLGAYFAGQNTAQMHLKRRRNPVSRFLPEAAIMKLFMNTHNVPVAGQDSASDLDNIQGALIVA